MGFTATMRSALTRCRKWYSSLNKPLNLLSFTVTGCIGIAGYKIVENYFAVTNSLYLTGVAALKNNEIVSNVIGEPIKIKSLKGLFKLKRAMDYEDKVVFTVEFKGKKNSGLLTVYGRKKDDDWTVQRVEAKLKEQFYYTNYILYRDADNDVETIFI